MTSFLSQHKYKIGFWGVIVPGTQIIASYANANAHAFYHDSSIGNIPGVGDIPNIVPATVVPALFALLMYGLYKAIKSAKPASEVANSNPTQNPNPNLHPHTDPGPTVQTMDEMGEEDFKSRRNNNDNKKTAATGTSSSDCCSTSSSRDWDFVDYLFCWIVLDNIFQPNTRPANASTSAALPSCDGPDCGTNDCGASDNNCTGGDGCNCDICSGCDLDCGGCDC